jgi:hypothetical protein
MGDSAMAMRSRLEKFPDDVKVRRLLLVYRRLLLV